MLLKDDSYHNDFMLYMKSYYWNEKRTIFKVLHYRHTDNAARVTACGGWAEC